MSFALLWGKILESSLWVQESKETRLVWITILAMKDVEGKVFASVVGLADRAKVTPSECRTALAVLTSPDANDSSGVEGGRRLRAIPGGWQVINNDLYRFSTELKREAWKLAKQEQRAKEDENKAERKKNGWKKFASSTKRTGETMAKKMADAGVPQPEIDAAAATCIPENLQPKPTDDIPPDLQ